MKIIITGSEGVIGKKLVPCLEKEGHKIIKCSKSLGHDLTNENFVKEWFNENKAPALVNLFGMNDHINAPNSENNVFNFTLDSINEYLNLNITTLFSVCREYAKHNKGSIINFSSIYGIRSPNPKLYNGHHKHVGYCASKAAVIQLSKYLAVHLSSCRVNTVICGGVNNNQSSEFKNKYEEKVIMKRMMEAEELGGLIEYLCSEKSSYCTGADFTIDGGITIL